MSPGDFLIICAVSFLATYAHLVFALIADKIGMVKLDFGKGLSMLLFGEAYEGKPPYALGLIAVHLNGIIFGLMYATVGAGYICGPPVFRGLVWGGALLIFSQCVFNPLITGHGFFSRKMHPRAWQTALIAHAIYGGVLGWLSPIL